MTQILYSTRRIIPVTETYFPMSVTTGTVTTLLHFDGVLGSQHFIDNSGWNHQYQATSVNTIIDTSQSVFGGSSCFFDGSGLVNNVDGSLDDFSFYTGDLTVDFWVRPSDLLATRTIIDFDVESGANGWQIYHNTLGDVFLWVHNNDAIVTGVGTLTANVWTHIAVVRTNCNFMMFINGIQTGVISPDPGFPIFITNPHHPEIGGDTSSVNKFKGWIDEVRIIKGYSVWGNSKDGGAFGVPSAPYPNINTPYPGT